jgi:hypothetical protein
MSPELIAIITAAIGLAGLNLVTTGRLSARIDSVEERLDARLTAVEKETARLSGLLEGLGLTGCLPPKS